MTEPEALIRRTGSLDRAPAEFLAGVLGVESPGDELPPMWHQVYLLDRWARSELGDDGHPRSGVPTPPEEPHRRMFAGGRAQHLRPLRFDQPLAKTSRVLSSTVKEGRSGTLNFVTVQHEYAQSGSTAVIDEQDIVYRPLPPAEESSWPAKPAPGTGEELADVRRFDVDPVVLFLFSNATANAHRIHYDVEFARSEGHPDLVVHGPLQILLMAGALVDSGRSMSNVTFDYRLLAPAWGAQTLSVGQPVAGDADVVVVDASGRRTARASVTP